MSSEAHDVAITSVVVTVKGADWEVNILVVSIIARSFGSYPACSPNLRWNPYADLDRNLEISIFDVSFVAREYGKEWRYMPPTLP